MTAPIDDGLTRYRWYRPEDPPHTAKAVVDRVRERLKQIDQRLDIWWNQTWRPNDPHETGRWAVTYWMEKYGRWSIVFYYEGAGGEYRTLDLDCAEPILNFLAEIDTSRQGNDMKDRTIREANGEHARKEKARAERIDAARERMDEGRAVFGQKILIPAEGAWRKRTSRLA